jgi:hypothetical protein
LRRKGIALTPLLLLLLFLPLAKKKKEKQKKTKRSELNDRVGIYF